MNDLYLPEIDISFPHFVFLPHAAVGGVYDLLEQAEKRYLVNRLLRQKRENLILLFRQILMTVLLLENERETH